MSADATPQQALADTIKALMQRARETGVDSTHQIAEAKQRF